MKNPVIAKMLKYYRKANNLSVDDIAAYLSQTKPFTAGKAVRPSPMPIFSYISVNITVSLIF